VTLIPATAFDTVIDGGNVSLYTLRAGDIIMQMTNFGGRVVALWTPDREGKYRDIALGLPAIADYTQANGERFLGPVVGRYANRIAGGRFTLDSVEYVLPQNNNGQTLHGGLKGLDMVAWNVDSLTDNSIALSYLSPDGADGFPGNLSLKMVYTLTPNNDFQITYQARTDKPTVVNLSHHGFFNLHGEGNGSTNDHVLTINGSAIVPVNEVRIPTGELMPVEGTPFDFRQPHVIGERIGEDHEQLKMGMGYDHNWVLDRKSAGDKEFAAKLYEPSNGRTVEVWTDQPGIQFYSGNFFNGATTGKHGQPHRWREGVALETQKFPDSPNQPQFPSTRLDPGETYTQVCVYHFGAE
ncbi:MAG: galactose mutarotase, partial [Rikenellaceae bacterium]|nr:galactose mutarotase [Rikenellaceae bacterium]